MATYTARVLPKSDYKREINVEFEVPDYMAGTADPEIKRRAKAAAFNADVEKSGTEDTFDYKVQDLKEVRS